MTLSLLQARFRYDDGTFIRIDAENFERLLHDEKLVWPASARLRRGAPALVHDGRMEDVTFVLDPPACLDLLLDHARLVTWTASPVSTLILVDPAPLRDVLLRTAPKVSAALPKRRLDKKPFWQLRKIDRLLKTVATDEAKAAIQRTGAFYGMAGVCCCGEPGCSSSHVWIRDHMVLLLVENDPLPVKEIVLFPGKIVA